jgi:predicted CopG family antitoxin
MKTIALNERTFQILKDLKKKEEAGSFDEIVLNLVVKERRMPKSLFGSLRGRSRSFTVRERREIGKDAERGV